jgi:hypothetical protein
MGMTDVFEDWKKNKFIVVGEDLLDKDETLIILTDISYWAEHEAELASWCKQHDVDFQGMCLAFNDPKMLIMFALRWS